MDQVFSQVLAVLLLVVTATFANTLYFQPKTEMVCPDNKHSCTSDTTCCLLPDGEYGCCMYANAVCCSDNIHCCPTGSYCDVNTGSCDKDGVKFEWSKKAPAALYVPKEKMESKPAWVEKVPPMSLKFQQPASIPWAKKLPGLKVNSLNISTLQLPVSCSVSQTLCKSDNGLSGCCPFPNAVCCEKTQLCCPSGFQCNLKSSKCEKPTEETTKEMETLTSGRTLFALRNSVVCPDITTTCPENFTCCLGKDSYACCPYPSATCCADREHCCPNGYTCQVSAGSCVKKQVDMILVKMTKWKSEQFCPDMETYCTKDSTCCPLEGGSYGCCPYTKATCCSDGKHCCPNGYTCDVAEGECVQRDSQMQLSAHVIVCPDKTSTCPSSNTCCQLPDGTYGCCRYPKATCCSDDEHCCPAGYTCDLAHSRCVMGDSQIQLSAHITVCPDKITICPSSSTCCPLRGGGYGCCPYPQATCCSDDEHCCPAGYTCDLAHSRCVMGDSQIQLSAHITVCPDKITICPSSSTCCPLPGGKYGCCLYPKATCCSDDEHCCPAGYTCDLAHSRCVMGDSQIQLSAHVTVCPDKITKCPSSNTCCMLPDSKYGCCPYPQAICCKDQVHCCPNGYTCDDAQQFCIPNGIDSSELSIPLTTLQSSDSNKCPDQTTCPTGTTCCLTKSGYACCPLPEAVCCQDNKHCCPKNFHCDLEHKRCVMGQTSLPLYRKFLPSKSLTAMKLTKKLSKSVMCPDNSECPDHNTCCLMDTGAWGCCPFLNAVCCIDRRHCCPESFSCDMKAKKCISVHSSINPIFSMFTSKMKPLKKIPSKSTQ